MPELAQPLPTFDPASLVGATLDGRYELVSHLATGGMGAVFRARHVHLRKDVAVKVLRPDLCSSPEIVERFRREAEIASALEHENIVRVTDFGRTTDGYLFLVMELLGGESLFDRLRREGSLPPEEAVPILWQICAGLEAAHAMGVVHRDLKPENVFLVRTSSGREVAKLLDFGIAKITDPPDGSTTQAGMVVGTPEYLAPEQAMGGAVDARADLYAVGLIAWRILAGRHPFKADDARGLLMMQATKPVPPLTEPRPDLGAWPALVGAVARACAKEPTERPQSAAELRDLLEVSLGPAFVRPPGGTPAPPLSLSPVPFPSGRFGAVPATGGPDWTRSITPTTGKPSWSLVRAMQLARARLRLARLHDAARRLVRRGAGRGRMALAWARARPLATAAVLSAVAVALAVAGISGWQHGRAASLARAHLAAGRAADARAAADAALARHPADAELLLLRGEALHRLGQIGEGIDTYAAARAVAPLDRAALRDLVQDLGRERTLADRAARVLRDAGPAALPAVLAVAKDGAPSQRLRALTLLRDVGAEEQVDRVAAYGTLLAEPDCDLRRAAAHRLGEIGDRGALPRLRELAVSRRETKGFLGLVTRSAACGAPEAAEAAKRIEALNR